MVPMSMRGFRVGQTCAWIACLSLGQFSPGPVQAEPESARRSPRDNPIAGFRMTIPEDWEMGAGVTGNTDIAIDAPSGPSLLAEPALTFYYAARAPEAEARALAALLQAVFGTTPQAGPTRRDKEWEVRATVTAGILGPVDTRWLCRTEQGTNYVVAGFLRRQFASQYQQDVEAALTSCHLIPRPTLWRFSEPTERAYYLAIPEGWRWKDGQIVRGPNVPGFFTYTVERLDGLAGGFVSPPVIGLVRQYTPAQAQAKSFVLAQLRAKVPDLRLVDVTSCTRATPYFTGLLRAVVPGSRPCFDKVFADYEGTINGVPLRARVCILTKMNDAPPEMAFPTHPGAPQELLISGAWAPADQFHNLYPLIRGIQASMQMDFEWKRRTQQTVDDVLSFFKKAGQKGQDKWDEYIRYGSPSALDSQGNRYTIPGGPGIPYLDEKGEPKLAPPGQDPPSNATRLNPVQAGG